ncbi:UDP-N-acetyl-D-glucosamine 6-dehydrogenase [Sporomusa rhizae]|uniref:nucleotide sugar dehydrogenase n=1 Tax=Sporomusa rhizae TaxID=357999 RepID=UPI00352B6243
MVNKIVVVGLGYVGLPLAIAFAQKFPEVIGFDVNEKKIQELTMGIDRTGEVTEDDLRNTRLIITSDIDKLRGADFFVVAVPTPIDKAHTPDLTAVTKASETVGKVIQQGAIVVFESTVYPGITEKLCGDTIARVSGLRKGVDFKLGYSPERINPGDKNHRLETIVKVVSGEDSKTLDIVANTYGEIIDAGVYRASSIKVAEAAKVIENTQRDLNIALMNELAIIFDKMDIRTADVLEAANTKWNFLPFRPGLVGGHCIGVDPYYLTYKAEELGYQPQVILAGRRINDGMGKFIAEQTIKKLAQSGKNVYGARIGILGLTFKENVPDLRNSRVPDIISELREYGTEIIVVDPVADEEEAYQEYGISLEAEDKLQKLDAVILAVAHDQYIQFGAQKIAEMLNNKSGVIIDVKSIFGGSDFGTCVRYWSL